MMISDQSAASAAVAVKSAKISADARPGRRPVGPAPPLEGSRSGRTSPPSPITRAPRSMPFAGNAARPWTCTRPARIGGPPFREILANAMEAGARFLDSVGDEEKQSVTWAMSRASVQQHGHPTDRCPLPGTGPARAAWQRHRWRAWR